MKAVTKIFLIAYKLHFNIASELSIWTFPCWDILGSVMLAADEHPTHNILYFKKWSETENSSSCITIV